jgi:oligopeptide/dipeptide ABC transporter ATP-binding protein
MTMDRAVSAPPLVEVKDIVKHFPVTGGVFGRVVNHVRAVEGVTFSIRPRETLSLVGESGCGKSTVGRCVARLTELTSGEVWLDGERIDNLPERTMKRHRKRFNIVFQDPFSSLDPRQTVEGLIAEPLRNHGLIRNAAERRDRVAELLDRVGMAPDLMRRMPHAFSGGQRQRIGIARALASEPDFLICDEAVSALDVSVQAQIVNLLMRLKHELGLSLLFISHDLAVVEHLSDRVAVMYLGRIMEITDRQSLYARPGHPYTRALLSAVPLPDPKARRERVLLRGDVPSPINPPSGCVFRTRCPIATDRCSAEIPALREVVPGHHLACHHVEVV